MFNTYINKNSLVHKLNPVFKLVVIFIMLITAIFINNYMELILLTLYVVTIILYSNINIKKYLENIKDIKYLLLLILIIDIICLNFRCILFDEYRIIFVIIIICIYLNTTRNSEILFSIQKILYKFKNNIPVSEIALLILLVLKFIPIYISRIKIIKISEKGIKKALIIYKKEFGNVLIDIKKTIDIAYINLFCYNIEKKSYYARKWGKIENYLLVLNLVILCIVIYY